jgi:hypothetical protein
MKAALAEAMSEFAWSIRSRTFAEFSKTTNITSQSDDWKLNADS